MLWTNLDKLEMFLAKLTEQLEMAKEQLRQAKIAYVEETRKKGGNYGNTI